MSEPNFDEIYIVGVRLSFQKIDAELFCLVIYEEKERVLTNEGNVIFTSDYKKIEFLYAFLDTEIKNKYKEPSEVKTTIDVARCLYLLENENSDQDSVILDCLNFTFDAIDSINSKMPILVKDILFSLADHLTFSDNLTEFFRSGFFDRAEVINSYLWCLGKIASKTFILDYD